jgi:hypothetical protein
MLSDPAITPMDEAFNQVLFAEIKFSLQDIRHLDFTINKLEREFRVL